MDTITGENDTDSYLYDFLDVDCLRSLFLVNRNCNKLMKSVNFYECLLNSGNIYKIYQIGDFRLIKIYHNGVKLKTSIWFWHQDMDI